MSNTNSREIWRNIWRKTNESIIGRIKRLFSAVAGQYESTLSVPLVYLLGSWWWRKYGEEEESWGGHYVKEELEPFCFPIISGSSGTAHCLFRVTLTKIKKPDFEMYKPKTEGKKHKMLKHTSYLSFFSTCTIFALIFFHAKARKSRQNRFHNQKQGNFKIFSLSFGEFWNSSKFGKHFDFSTSVAWKILNFSTHGEISDFSTCIEFLNFLV